MLKTKFKSIFLLLWLILLFSCNTRVDNDKTIEKISTKSTAIIDTVIVYDTIVKQEINPFRYEKLKQYGDSINSYFQTFGWGRKGYEFDVKYDTIVNENNIEYAYRKYVPFSVYVFESEEEATDYFNELMTIEFVSIDGINKKPNHIFVDSNRVVWLKMEHAYVHRAEKIIDIFRKVFNTPAINLNYYKNKGFKRRTRVESDSSDINLKQIYGKWRTNRRIKIDTVGYAFSYYDGIINSEIDILTLDFSESSVIINDEKFLYNISRVIKLPDIKHCWEYRFVSFANGRKRNSLTLEFYEEIKKLQKVRSSIITYSIGVNKNNKDTGYFTIVKTSKNEVYITLDNHFYST